MFFGVWLQILDMKLTIDGLEKERDFYFGKLRDIELICQENESDSNNPVLGKIIDILYATEVNEVRQTQTPPRLQSEYRNNHKEDIKTHPESFI